MRPYRSLCLAAICLSAASAQQRPILFEGARLIVGDGAVVDNSAFLIENGKFTKIATKGNLQLPAGAVRVNLTGKTVMPALIDAHTHYGWQVVNTGRMAADTYTKENSPIT